MGIFDGYLLVSDIDGTLAVEGRPVLRNLEAVETFKSDGGLFTLATGRGPVAAKALCHEAKVNAPALLSNGSVVFDIEGDRILSSDYLSESAKSLTYDVIKSFPSVGVEVTLGDCILTLQENSDTVVHRAKEEFRLIKPVKEVAVESSWIKVIFMTSNRTAYRQLCEYMDNNCPSDCCLIATSRSFYELHPKWVNKGAGIKKLSKLLNIPIDHIFAIGDYYNDREMIAEAAVGACVAHSPKEIKEISQFVGGEATAGAVADFIKYLTLKRRSGAI